MTIVRLDHIQLAIPIGGEPAGRAFFGELLGLPEKPKPESLAARGGVWFERDGIQLHLGVDADFRPATKAHPAFVVDDFEALVHKLRSAGHAISSDEPVGGHQRVFVRDPFGNRIELIDVVPSRT